MCKEFQWDGKLLTIDIKLSSISKPELTIAQAIISQSSVELTGKKPARQQHAKIFNWWSSGSRIESIASLSFFDIFQTF